MTNARVFLSLYRTYDQVSPKLNEITLRRLLEPIRLKIRAISTLVNCNITNAENEGLSPRCFPVVSKTDLMLLGRCSILQVHPEKISATPYASDCLQSHRLQKATKVMGEQ